MRNLLILLIFMMLTSQSYTKDNDGTGKIIVKIINLKNNKGNIRSQLFNNPDDFPTHSDKAYKRTIGKIVNDESTLIYDNIPFGEWAITVHHDEDLNRLMNKNIFGYPKEGYGISNNPKIILKLPTFEESKFTLNKKEITIIIKMKE